QALLVDAVADTLREMPLDRHAERREPARGLEQSLRRNEIVLIAMDEQHRRPRLDLGRELLRIGVGRHDQHSRITDHCERRWRAPEAMMQRHHGALAEADQRQRRRLQIAALELGVEKTLQHRRCLVDAEPAFVRIAERERKPLSADGSLAAGLRRVWRDKSGIRQEPLPGAADVDEVVAVGAIAVQKHHQLARRSGARLESRSVELRHWPSALLWFLVSRSVPWFALERASHSLGWRWPGSARLRAA